MVGREGIEPATLGLKVQFLAHFTLLTTLKPQVI